MKSIVKRKSKYGIELSQDVDRRGTIMEEGRSTKSSIALTVSKVGCTGAKDAVSEMNENILRAEAMYAAEEILNTLVFGSAREGSQSHYGTQHRKVQYSPSHPAPKWTPTYPQQGAMPPPAEYSQSALMDPYPGPTEYSKFFPYQQPPVEGDAVDIIETMDDVLYKMQVVQSDVEVLGNTCSLLLEDSVSKEKELRALVKQLEILRHEKADKELMYDLLETKASTNEVFDKLSHADFIEALEELSDGMMKAVHLICRQEMLFRDAFDLIIGEVGRKLNRFELQPIREIVNINLKKLYVRVKNIENMKKIAEAAATSRHLKTKDICLSCDTDALLKECKNVPIPIVPGFIPHTNMKPFLTYQMDRIRKNPPRKRICARYCGGSHTLMYRHGRLGRKVYVDYPCPPDSEIKPGERPKRQRGPKKTKKPSIDPESLKDMLWNSVVDHMDKRQQSYLDAPKIRDPYRKMKLATKLVVVDPDIASIDSRNIPTYQDTIWQLSEIDPSNPVLVDHLPIKVGKRGVYYPVSVSTTPGSHRPVPVPVSETTPDSPVPVAQQETSTQVKPTLDERSSKILRQSLEMHSTLEFKGRDDYKHHLTDVISKRTTFRGSTTDKSATDGETKPKFLGSRGSSRRETIMQVGRKKSDQRTSGQRVSGSQSSSQRLNGSLQRSTKGSSVTENAGDNYSHKRESALIRDSKSKTLKVDQVSHVRREGSKNKVKDVGSASDW